LENNNEYLHNPASDSKAFQSLVRGLNIPSKRHSIFIKEIHRDIIFIRDDQIHPVICGNKWRKLKYHLDHFYKSDHKGISSMGGAYSNHLHALAFVCNQLNIPCTLYIYGWNEELNSPTLMDCLNWNAALEPIARYQAELYRKGNYPGSDSMKSDYYWIPEGGGGVLGELGLKELVEELPENFDKPDSLIVCACGTGTTIQGILNQTRFCKISTHQIVKMASYAWIHHQRIEILNSKSQKSFAKKDQQLIDFIFYFENAYGILLDPVYTAPLMMAFTKISDWDHFESVYFIHTGGLQANRMI
jgi:1-aminocyclopropane-1-carboxylate deaminase